MRLDTDPQEGTLAHQRFRFQPPDPAWVPSDLVARTRKALHDYDSYLQLFWSPTRRLTSEIPGRWRVVQWRWIQNIWETVFFWEGPNGEYRDPSPDALLELIRKCDTRRTNTHVGEIAQKLDVANEAIKAKRWENDNAEAKRDAEDKATYGVYDGHNIDRAAGRKQHFTVSE